MDDAQFENWKQLIRKTLASTSGMHDQAAQRAKNMARIERTLAEIGVKLNGLIGHVQGQTPPQQ